MKFFYCDNKFINFLIILLIFKFILEINYIFRNYYYIIIYINSKSIEKKKKIYININYIIIVIDRIFILNIIKVKKIVIKLLIRELKLKFIISINTLFRYFI